MNYLLQIESDVDVCLDESDNVDVSFVPMDRDALPLGGYVQLSDMTYVDIKKYIASQIKFYHKRQVNCNTIKVFYNNIELSKGIVLDSLINIQALP